eukprot:2967038-Pleurochrysis_carterae.AAC.4
MPLRAAASQLRAMPELAEAAQYWRAGEVLKTIQPLQRVTQVVAPIPAYPLKVFAAGTLAQAMRCLGNEKGEESAWKEIGVGSSRGSAVKDVPNQLSALVALNGEAGYNLHVGNGHKASGLCTAGKLLLSDLEAHQNSSQAGSAAGSLHLTFAVHETLASTTSGFGDDAEALLVGLLPSSLLATSVTFASQLPMPFAAGELLSDALQPAGWSSCSFKRLEFAPAVWCRTWLTSGASQMGKDRRRFPTHGPKPEALQPTLLPFSTATCYAQKTSGIVLSTFGRYNAAFLCHQNVLDQGSRVVDAHLALMLSWDSRASVLCMHPREIDVAASFHLHALLHVTTAQIALNSCVTIA